MGHKLGDQERPSPFYAIDTKAKLNKEPFSVVCAAVRDFAHDERNWLSKEDLAVYHKLMSEDISDEIDWDYVISKHYSKNGMPDEILK